MSDDDNRWARLVLMKLESMLVSSESWEYNIARNANDFIVTIRIRGLRHENLLTQQEQTE